MGLRPGEKSSASARRSTLSDRDSVTQDPATPKPAPVREDFQFLTHSSPRPGTRKLLAACARMNLPRRVVRTRRPGVHHRADEAELRPSHRDASPLKEIADLRCAAQLVRPVAIKLSYQRGELLLSRPIHRQLPSSAIPRLDLSPKSVIGTRPPLGGNTGAIRPTETGRTRALYGALSPLESRETETGRSLGRSLVMRNRLWWWSHFRLAKRV